MFPGPATAAVLKYVLYVGPLVASAKTICDRIEALSPMGEYLGA